MSNAPGFLPAPGGPLVVPLDPGSTDGRVELSLILPTYRESRNIQTALREVFETLSAVEGLRFEIVVVDDNSPDGTAQLALDAAVAVPCVRVVQRTSESGLATAVIRGWQLARGQVLGVMDADLQHPPAVLAHLVEAMRGGADLAVASRHIEGGGVSDWSIFRRMISRTAQLIGLILLPEAAGRVSDPMSGYFLLRRKAIAGIPLHPMGYKILIEVLARGQASHIAETGYVFRERQRDESKVSARIYVAYLRHLLRLRLSRIRQSRFLRFCVVGLSGVIVDMTLLYLFSDPDALGWGLTRSKALAAEAAIVNNFFWNDRWTFADLVGENRSMEAKFHRFLKFNAICLLGLAFSIAVLNVLFHWFGMSRYAANAMAICVSIFWNYGVNKSLGWRSSH